MPHADLVLRSARIFTCDERAPWVQAVACRQGRVLAVGLNTQIDGLAGPGTEVIDVGGRLVLPGFIDAHAHLLAYATQRRQVDMFGVRSLDEVLRRVSQAAEKASPGEWILGGGWDELHWDSEPHRRPLDDVSAGHPAVLKRMDLHTCWVNSAALDAAGLLSTAPDVPGVERDPDGRPTGILREWDAISLVEPHIPTDAPERQVAWLDDVIHEAHRLGITGVHDQRVQNEGQVSFRLFEQMDEQGRLGLRVHMNIAAESLDWAADLGLQTGFGNDRLWLGHVKAFADGSMGSRTALMLDPYEGRPEDRGVAACSPEQLRDLAGQATSAGFPLSVHAIGDLAVRRVIDVLGTRDVAPTNGPPPRAPNRIEHVQIIHPDDLPRLARTGAVASVQPVHLLTDWQTADRVWGTRACHAYAFHSLLGQGVTLAFGSDAPVAPWNPLLGIHAAVTRQDEDGQPPAGWYPEEWISLADAVRAYTIGAARAAGTERTQGSISSGKWADMVVLSDNLFDMPVEVIRRARVLLTVFDGRVVHNRL